MMVHHIASEKPDISEDAIHQWGTCAQLNHMSRSRFICHWLRAVDFFRYDLINDIQMLFHQNAQTKQTNNLSTKHGQGLLAYSYRKSKHQYNSIHLIVLVIEMKRVLGYLISKKKESMVSN